jgi:hypothetical protein
VNFGEFLLVFGVTDRVVSVSETFSRDSQSPNAWSDGVNEGFMIDGLRLYEQKTFIQMELAQCRVRGCTALSDHKANHPNVICLGNVIDHFRCRMWIALDLH